MFHTECLELGFESKILSLTGDYQDGNVIYLKSSFYRKFDLSKIIRKLFFNFNSKYYYYPDWNTNIVTVNKSIKAVGFSPDIIFVYWTKLAFNFEFIQKLSDYYEAQIVFVLLDMGHLTGGCHYSFDCNLYTSGCGNCPVMPIRTSWDLSSMVINNRMKSLKKINASILAPTTLLLKQSLNSYLFSDVKKFLIPFPVNEEIFTNGCRIFARQILGLPLDKKIILFGASKLSEQRKGINLLIDSLALLKNMQSEIENQNCFLLIIGKIDVDLHLPFQYKSLGYQSSDEDLSLVFQACDLFLSPSVEDSGPLMVNFSLMCGRPVVAFNIGVAKDFVINGSTGYLANLPSVFDYVDGIIQILNLNDIEWNQYSNRSRQLALSRFSMKVHKLKLLKLVNELYEN
jgi:glycosyltransferase involved in cell wall biosynthesis